MANGAYAFDGSNDGLNFAHISTLNGATKLTIGLWLYPISSGGYSCILSCIGAATSGAGTTTGFNIQHPSTDATALYLAFRNGASTNEKVTNTGVLTINTWNAVWIVYDGTQGTAANRVRLWVNGTEITSWSSNTADFPANLGTNNQKLTFAYDEETGSAGLFNHARISDPTLFFGRAITDGTITSHAGGASGGNYVAAGDFWASFRVNQNDENGSRTGTLLDAPTLMAGPSLSYPGAVFDTARSNVAHSGNVHSGDFVQSFAITVAGTDRTTKMWSDEGTITDILGSEPSQFQGKARGFALTEGSEVKIFNGGIDVGVPYFCGHVVTSAPASQRKADQVAYDFTARDYTWFMDQHSRVTGYYENIGANTLVRQLLTSFAPSGFSGGYLPSTLGTVTAIGFENELLSAAISRIADQVAGGAFWSCEYDKTVSMWLASEDNPRWAGTTLTVTDTTVTTDQRAITYSVDLTQVRTRVIWEGGGGQATSVVGAGASTIPVNETGWYSSSGGTVRGGTSIITYTGVSASSGPGNITGCSGITRDIAQGESVYVRAQADDSAAQTALAALMGGDGIAVAFDSDNRLSLSECTNRAAADLASLSTAVRNISYFIDDGVNVVSGRPVSINITKPATVVATLRVQQVVTTKRSKVVGTTIGLERQVTASPTRVNLADLLLGVA